MTWNSSNTSLILYLCLYFVRIDAASNRLQKPVATSIVVGAVHGVEYRWTLNKSRQLPHVNSTTSCMKLSGFMATEVARSLLSQVTSSRSYHVEPDSVDHMPSFEFYPMVAGKWVDDTLKNMLDRFAQTAVLPYVRETYSCPDCCLADVLVRRYVPRERRTHQLHFDGHAFVTVVLGLNHPSEFDGGLYIQPEAHVNSREFVSLEPGELFVHSFDLQHGVRLWNGSRHSIVFWIKTSQQAVLQGTTPWYHSAAEKGDPDALFNLAEQHLHGTSGQDMDRKRAAELYEKAAASGHHGAQTHLGLLLAESGGDNLAASAHWLRQSAEAGSVLGQKSLAFAYAQGQGIPQNLTLAAEWMERAAEQDDLEAAYVLGTMFLHGQGVLASPFHAQRWLRHSADAGYADAQREMALLEKANLTAAVAWLQLAAGQGDHQARHLLADLYSRQDRFKEAIKLWRKLAKLGDAQAQWQLGRCYAQGRGTKTMPGKAQTLLSKAAAQGHKEAAEDLATLATFAKTQAFFS